VIVRILSNGTSFKGCAAYLAHDANRADTAERVNWTHTHNLANDDVPCAVNEMLWTAREAEFLKQEAGVRAGGRATENTVKHFSLNWSPDDKPSREHMVQSTEDFLRHMGWEDHQAIFFSHTDKPHAHVHVMLNTVHPDTGLRLNDNFDHRRAQAWARQYELEHERIYCEQRFLNPAEREKSMPRNIWEAFRHSELEFGKSEKLLLENTPIILNYRKGQKNDDWELLKEIQRAEREDHFAQGKFEFRELRNSIYREVREEFRGCWAEYYSGLRADRPPEEMGEFKRKIMAEQKGVLDKKRDEACRELRASRDIRYKGLLHEQEETRKEFLWRQEAGLDTAQYLQEIGERRSGTREMRTNFREAAQEIAARPPNGGRDAEPSYRGPATNGTEGHNSKPGRNSDIRLSFGVGSFFGTLLADLFNLGSAPHVPELDSDRQDQFEAAAEEALKQQQRDHEHERDDDERRQKHRSFHGD
jgi:Relaxase/Mobilisation nuclease domain